MNRIKKGFLVKGGPRFHVKPFCLSHSSGVWMALLLGQDMPVAQDRRPSCFRSQLPGLAGSYLAEVI